jgi:AP2 domain
MTTSTTATKASVGGGSFVLDRPTTGLKPMSYATSPSSPVSSLVMLSTPRVVGAPSTVETVESRMQETSPPLGESDPGIAVRREKIVKEMSCSKAVNTYSNDDSFRTPAPSMTTNCALSSTDNCQNNSNDTVRQTINQITPYDGANIENAIKSSSIMADRNSFGSQSHPVSRRGGRFVSPSKKTPFFINTSTPLARDDGSVDIKAAVSFKEDDVAVIQSGENRSSLRNSSENGQISVTDDDCSSNTFLEFPTFRSSKFDSVIPVGVKIETQDGSNSDSPSSSNIAVPLNRIGHSLRAAHQTNTQLIVPDSDDVVGNSGDLLPEDKSNREIVDSEGPDLFVAAISGKEPDCANTAIDAVKDANQSANSVLEQKLSSHETNQNPITSEIATTNSRCRSPPVRHDGINSNGMNNRFPFPDVKSPGVSMFWLSPGPPTPKSPGRGTDKPFATPTKLFDRSNFSNPPQSANAAIDINASCPDTGASYDSTSNVLAWLQSPSRLFSPGGEFAPSMTNTPLHKTPRTPIVSTSFFFSDAASLPKSAAAGEVQPKVTSTTYTINDNVCSTEPSRRWRDRDGNNNVICVSPMLYHTTNNEKCEHQPSNSLMNTPAAMTGATPMMADLHDVFASPTEKSSSKMIRGLPLLNDEDDTANGSIRCNIQRRLSSHHLTPRTQRATVDDTNDDGNDGINSMHKHSAERDLMEDDDLCVLIQLASNNNPNTPRSSSLVFRSSPLARHSYKAGDSVEHDRSKLSDSVGVGESVTTSQQVVSLNGSTCESNSHLLQQKPLEFDPPPTISGMKANPSIGASKEIYAGPSKQQYAPNQNSVTQQSREEDTAAHEDSRTKGHKDNSVGHPAASLVTPTSRNIGESPATTSSTPYPPIHYQYNSMSMGHPGGYLPSIPMSGSMRVIVGGQPPGTSNPSSQGSGQYPDYHAMSTYAHPGGAYGQYPPPTHHGYGHLASASYPSYPPPSHYTVPPPPAPIATCSSGSITRGDSEYTTPHTITGKNTVKTGIEKGSNHKDNKRTKRSSDTKLTSSSIKKKKETSSGTPDLPVSYNDSNKNDGKSPSKRAKPKLVLVSKKSPSSTSGDVICSSSTKKSKDKDQSDAAALAAAILRGVTMRPSGKWQAQLYFAGKSRYIGVFDSREKAALAYEIAREKLKNGESGNPDKSTTESLVNAARKAAFDGVNSSG